MIIFASLMVNLVPDYTFLAEYFFLSFFKKKELKNAVNLTKPNTRAAESN